MGGASADELNCCEQTTSEKSHAIIQWWESKQLITIGRGECGKQMFERGLIFSSQMMCAVYFSLYFFFLLLPRLPPLTSRGDDALAVTMTHPFDTLIIISSHLIRLTNPGEFRREANMKFSSSLTPAYPPMKMSICLHVNLLQKEHGFFLVPHCVHISFHREGSFKEKK